MRTSKHWIILLVSAGFEAIWATALSASQGFTQLAPSIVFAVTAAISMIGLGYAMKALPVSVAYAVWTGVGAVLTVLIAWISGTEVMTVMKFVFLAGIIGCVVGLKVVDGEESRES